MNVPGLLQLVIAALSFTSVHASLFDHHEALGMACAIGAQELFTSCEEEDYSCYCDSTLYVYAVENCIGKEAHYNSTLMGMAFDKFNIKFCEFHNSKANTTDVWSAENQARNPTVTGKAYKLAYSGEVNDMSQKAVSVWLGIGLILYWVTIVGSTIFFRVFRLFSIRLFTARIVMRRSPKPIRMLYHYVLWPALFGTKHMQKIEYFRGWVAFSWPTRFDSVLVSVYIVLIIIFMLTPYTFMNNDPLYSSRWKEMMRYASDRAGIMATVQFPMLFLFAMRNNILIWLTGWSYSTFNTYHRAVARVTYILLIVHAVMKHIFSLSYGGSMTKYYYPLPYFRYGCAAIGLFTLMIVFAVLRGRMYEIFYRLHQAMALGGIICSLYHLNGIGFKTPLWVALAFWAADWTIRVLKIILFNVNFITPPLPGARRVSFATARIYGGEMIKLSITTPVRWVCKPGQYVYIHTNQWTFIGGHPFSVVGLPKDIDSGLEVVIKARSGVTRKLFSNLDDRSCTPEYPVTIPIYVEGPYGVSAPVCDSEKGLFFAGGIGITGVLAYIEHMAQSTSSGTSNRDVKLFWAIRDKMDIDPFAERLYKLRRVKNVHIRIFQRVSSEGRTPRAIGIDFENMGAFPTNPDYILKHPGLATVELDDSTSWNKEKVQSSFTSSPNSNPYPSNQRLSDSPTHNIPTSDAAATLFSKRRFTRVFSEGEDTDAKVANRPTTRHKHKRSDFRQSIVQMVTSRNPEYEDNYDYGKEDFLEANNTDRSSTVTAESLKHARHHSITPPPPNTVDQSYKERIQYPTFVDAGFADKIAERRYTILNPFDETVYPYTEIIGGTKDIIGETQQSHINELYSIVEPIGMDVVGLIRHYFKHSDGSICVMGCGPDRMMDTLRWSCCECHDLVQNGHIDYYEEAFKW